MLLTFANCELWTAIYLFWRAVVWLLDDSLPSFPDLFQPFSWALLELSVFLRTQPLYWVSLPTLSNILSVSLPTPPLYVGLRWQSFATWPSRLQLKQCKTAFTLAMGNLSELEHLLAKWPNVLHLLHLKGGPLAAEGDLSFTERIALSSSREISIAWEENWFSSTPNDSLDTFVI